MALYFPAGNLALSREKYERERIAILSALRDWRARNRSPIQYQGIASINDVTMSHCLDRNTRRVSCMHSVPRACHSKAELERDTLQAAFDVGSIGEVKHSRSILNCSLNLSSRGLIIIGVGNIVIIQSHVRSLIVHSPALSYRVAYKA